MNIQPSTTCCGMAAIAYVDGATAQQILMTIRENYRRHWRERPGIITATTNNNQATTDRELEKAGFVKVWEGPNPRYNEGYTGMYANHRMKLWLLDLNPLEAPK